MSLKLKQRDNGVWYVTGTIDGRRHRQSLGTDQKEIAALRFAETQSKIQKAAIYGTEFEATFADAALKYLQDNKDIRFIEPLIRKLGNEKLKDIKPGTIKALAKRLHPDCAPSTWNRQVITPAKAIINFGAELGICHPIRIAKFKEVGSKKPQAVDKIWHEKFIEHAETIQIAAIDLLMFTTGTRITNALELGPEDFNLDNATAMLKQTKNGEAHMVHLTDDLVAMIREIKPTQVKDGSYRMFGFYCRSSVYKPWRRTCEKAGIPYIPPHQCGRHSFATELIIRNKVDVKTVARLGGWKSVRLLLDSYTHPEGEEENIQKVFGGVSVKRDDTPDNIVRLRTKRKAV